MEEIEYSCEKCSGKAATVSHKFSRLPRFVLTHSLALFSVEHNSNIWMAVSLQGAHSSPQTLQLQHSAVFKQQAGPTSPDPQVFDTAVPLHRGHTPPSQPRLERTDGPVSLALLLSFSVALFTLANGSSRFSSRTLKTSQSVNSSTLRWERPSDDVYAKIIFSLDVFTLMCFKWVVHRKGSQKPESSGSVLCDSDSEEELVRKVGRRHHPEDDRTEEVRGTGSS